MKKALFIFRLYYMLYVLVAFTALLNGKRWFPLATVLLVVTGAIVGIWMIVNYKMYLKTKNVILIILFLLSYAFSSVMNIQYGYIGNLVEMLWIGFTMAIMYIGVDIYTETEVKKEFSILAKVYVGYVLALCIISIWMYFLGESYKFIDDYGMDREIGYKWARLLGAFDDPNHGATIVSVGIVLTIYLITTTKKIIWRILMTIAVVIQYIYIILSDSRTGMIAIAIAVLVGLGIILYRFISKRRNNLVGGIISGLICVICLVALIPSTIAIKEGMKQINIAIQGTDQIELIEEKERKLEKDLNKGNRQVVKMVAEINLTPNVTQTNDEVVRLTTKLELEEIAREADKKDDISNGRFDIWVSGLEVVNTTPIYGTSFRNIVPYTKDKLPDTYIVNLDEGAVYESLHNSIMDVLVSQGLIGIIILCLFIYNTFTYTWKQWKYKNMENFTVQLTCFTILMSLFGASMFLSMVFYINSPQTYMFWLCMGYFMVLLKEDSSVQGMEYTGKK